MLQLKLEQNMSWQNNTTVNGTTKSTFSALDHTAVTTWLSFCGSLCFVCTLNNALVIGLILCHRKLRTACGVLIAHSLIAHTALCAIVYPVQALLIGLKQLDHLSVIPQYCDLIMWFQMTCRYAANLIESCIAMNRVVALCWPYKYRSFTSLTLGNVVVTVCWVGSAVMASLGCFDLGVDYVLASTGNCTYIQRGQFAVIYLVMGYYLPFGLTGAGYILVNLKIWLTKRRRIMEMSSVTKNAQQLKGEKRRRTTANMMFVSFIWNALCYLFVPTAMNVAPSFFTMRPLILLWLGFLPVLGYGTEPMIFFVMNKEYRNEFSRTMRRLTQRGDASSVSEVLTLQKTGNSKL